MSSYNAKKQFNENLQLFGNPNTEPEKYNLYAGLANLADAIASIEAKLDQIETKIRQ